MQQQEKDMLQQKKLNILNMHKKKNIFVLIDKCSYDGHIKVTFIKGIVAGIS